MNRTLTMALILGILCSVPKSYASDRWEDGDMIGAVATVLVDGILLKNIYLKLPASHLKQGESYYEYGTSKYQKTNETIFIYTDTAGFQTNDLIAGSVRYQNMHLADKPAKFRPKVEPVVSGRSNDSGRNARNEPFDRGEKVRAFAVVGTLKKLESEKDIKGPIAAGGSAKGEGRSGR